MSKEKLMTFLSSKLEECKQVIKKRKRKNKIIKTIYITLMTCTISGSVVVSLLSSITVPFIAVESIAAGVAIASALSLKFNLEHKNKKLVENIQNLEKIKDKLDYVTACNGDISDEECNFILNQFRIL
jgi:cobalamin biosynthesis protein CobD/CbiB